MTMVIEQMAEAINRHVLNAFLGGFGRTIAANNPLIPTGASVAKNRLSGDATEADNTFRDLLQQRNNSILAHGLKPVSENSARKFLEYVDAIVDKPEVRALAQHSRLREL
jgi:hypothetical protein